MHGRKARGSGHPECPVWLTEFGIASPEDGITNVAAAYELKAKNALRGLCVYLTKGCKTVYLFHPWPDWGSGGLDLELFSPEFMNYTNQYGTYPPNPGSYRSAVMMGVKRLKDTLDSGMNTGAFTVRQLSVSSVTDTHNAFQFPPWATGRHFMIGKFYSSLRSSGQRRVG
jgi:hypothetical protein